MGFAAGAMTILDTEPLDGVNYENGVFGYITLVHSIDLLSYEHVALTGFIGNSNITDPEWVWHRRPYVLQSKLFAFPYSGLEIINDSIVPNVN